jgi:hypothetical protein
MRTHVYGCKYCGEKDPMEFYGHQKIVCKACRKLQAQERLRLYKQQLVDYAGGKCQICGYSKSLNALHFHHRNPAEKDIDYEKMKNWSFASRKNEIDKCILVCHNCHAEIHDKRMKGNEPTTPMPLMEG